ncbi:MAG: SAM-dependent methyltransferase [Hyphomicrobiales bacterium]|nr:MAG: SAM-dependent methyltransferase [Hyphomicrobiales bacterium]
MPDRRLNAPAVARNRDAILEVLRGLLPATGLVLEIASGSGEHVAHFAGALPGLTFQPSDPNPNALDSIAAWAEQSGARNILPPIRIDAAAERWPANLRHEQPDAILCINMIHIAPWAAAQGLLSHAGALLAPGAPLILYGPFKRASHPLEPSNAAFDESLRERNPDWGLRDLDEVAALAAEAGFGAPEVIEMPANNLTVVFRRRSLAST